MLDFCPIDSGPYHSHGLDSVLVIDIPGIRLVGSPPNESRNKHAAVAILISASLGQTVVVTVCLPGSLRLRIASEWRVFDFNKSLRKVGLLASLVRFEQLTELVARFFPLGGLLKASSRSKPCISSSSDRPPDISSILTSGCGSDATFFGAESCEEVMRMLSVRGDFLV